MKTEPNDRDIFRAYDWYAQHSDHVDEMVLLTNGEYPPSALSSFHFSCHLRSPRNDHRSACSYTTSRHPPFSHHQPFPVLCLPQCRVMAIATTRIERATLSKDELYRARVSAVVRIRLLDDIDKLRELLREQHDALDGGDCKPNLDERVKAVLNG